MDEYFGWWCEKPGLLELFLQGLPNGNGHGKGAYYGVIYEWGDGLGADGTGNGSGCGLKHNLPRRVQRDCTPFRYRGLE